jgi:hypothetical protein
MDHDQPEVDENVSGLDAWLAQGQQLQEAAEVALEDLHRRACELEEQRRELEAELVRRQAEIRQIAQILGNPGEPAVPAGADAGNAPLIEIHEVGDRPDIPAETRGLEMSFASKAAGSHLKQHRREDWHPNAA